MARKRKWLDRASLRPLLAPPGGFTLIEVLASLAVVSVGTFIFLSLFTTSMGLAHGNRLTKLATERAETQLFELTHRPSEFQWPALDELEAGALAEVKIKNTDGPAPCTPATINPIDENARKRAETLDAMFTWNAYARLPKPDAAYLEATVVIRWEAQGRPGILAITGCIPRSAIGGGL